MAELDFYMKQCTAETIVLDFLLKEGFVFTPSKLYPDKKALYLNNFDSVKEAAYQVGYLYLTHPSITKYDFVLKDIIKENKEYFYIMDKYGGPYLDLYFPKQYEENNVLNYSAGSIGAFNIYYQQDGENIRELDTTNLKEAYRKVCNHVRKHTIVIKTIKGRTYRITEELLENARKGEAILNGFSEESLKNLFS